MSNYTAIECTVLHISKKAVLIEVEGEETWVPMSCIFEEDLDEIAEGVIGEVNVVDWFCKKEGLI